MELERGKGLALWRQIQKALEQDIVEGIFGPGDKLPPERLLAERFGVNRHTLRQALNTMTRKGLVRAEQGRGYFVREDMVHYSLARRVRFRENLSRQRREAEEEFLGWEVVQAGRRASEALMVRPGTSLVHLRSVGRADGASLCLNSHFFPHARFPDIAERYGCCGSVTASFRALGIADYTRLQTLITARMPTAQEARLLDQPRSKPVMELESVNVDRDGVPIEYGRCLWSSDRVQFVVEAGVQHLS